MRSISGDRISPPSDIPLRSLGCEATAWNNLGCVHVRLGDDQRAEEAFRRAEKCDPHFSIATENLGDLFARRGDFGAAIDSYRTARKTGETSDKLLRKLGIALINTGQMAEAGLALEELTERFPEDPRSWSHLAIYHQIHGDAELAATMRERAVAVAGNG